MLSHCTFQDEKVQLTVLTDRSQGGSSTSDGSLELMVSTTGLLGRRNNLLPVTLSILYLSFITLPKPYSSLTHWAQKDRKVIQETVACESFKNSRHSVCIRDQGKQRWRLSQGVTSCHSIRHWKKTLAAALILMFPSPFFPSSMLVAGTSTAADWWQPGCKWATTWAWPLPSWTSGSGTSSHPLRHDRVISWATSATSSARIYGTTAGVGTWWRTSIPAWTAQHWAGDEKGRETEPLQL